MKILIGAVVGAVVMFIWGFAAHMVTPLGQAGWKRLPDEPAVRAALKESIPEPGLYMFPGHEPDAPREEVEAVMADWAKGPSGILIWHPAGADAMSGKQLGMQFAAVLASVLLAAVVVSMTSAGFVGKVLISTLIGLVSFLYVHVPEWIWFGYPQDYVVAQLIMTLVGWALTGVALAVIIKPKEKPA